MMRGFAYTKPVFGTPLGANINLPRPLCVFALNEYGGQRVFDGMNAQPALTLYDTASWGRSTDQLSPLGINSTTGNQSGCMAPTAPQLQIQPPLTILWRGVVQGNVSGTNPRLFSVEYSNSDATAPYVGYGMYRPNNTDLTVAFNMTGTFTSQAYTNVVTVGAVQTLVATITKAPLTGDFQTQLYVNGAPQGLRTNAGPASIQYSATSQVVIAREVSNNAVANVVTNLCAIWATGLTREQVMQVSSMPWSLYARPAMMGYAIAAAPPPGGNNGQIVDLARASSTSAGAVHVRVGY